MTKSKASSGSEPDAPCLAATLSIAPTPDRRSEWRPSLDAPASIDAAPPDQQRRSEMGRIAKKDLAIHPEVSRELSDQLAGRGVDLSGVKPRKKTVAVSAIMLRGDGNDLVVEAEIAGRWVDVIRDGTTCYEPAHTISHIVEALGIRRAAERPPEPGATEEER